MATYRCSICNRKGHNARTCKQKAGKKKIASKKTCGICGKTGHNARTCDHKQKKKKTLRKKKLIKTCSICGEPGHNARTCDERPKKKGLKKKTQKKKKTKPFRGVKPKCEECGAKCIVKLSRWNNEFWACPNWPNCPGKCPRDIAVPERTHIPSSERDLRTTFNNLNHKYFDGRMTARVRWSRRPLTSRWGYYRTRQNLITINVILRSNDMPYECFETTLYHEMLHEDIPVSYDPVKGCRIIHGPEFKRREALHPDYQYAKQWKKKHGGKLLDKSSASRSSVGQTFEGLHVGQQFTFRRTIYTITGFKPSRWKYPISAEGPRGGRYKFSIAQVKGRRNPICKIDEHELPGFRGDVFSKNPLKEARIPVCQDGHELPGFRNDVIL